MNEHATPIDADGIRAFFARFDGAFATFDGETIGARYAAPYLACRIDGTAESFPDAESIADYFQAVVDEYHSSGVRSCTHESLTIRRLAGPHVLATVTWHLWDSDEVEVVAWRESYVLTDDGRDLLIRSSVDHPP